MVEFIRHLLGVCGEHWHPNLLNLSVFLLGITWIISYIKYKIKIVYGKRINKK